MGIDLKLDKAKGSVTVTVSGDIDMSSSTKMRDVLTPLFQNDNKVIVVDLSGVSYIDSSGIATLVEGLQHPVPGGGFCSRSFCPRTDGNCPRFPAYTQRNDRNRGGDSEK